MPHGHALTDTGETPVPQGHAIQTRARRPCHKDLPYRHGRDARATRTCHSDTGETPVPHGHTAMLGAALGERAYVEPVGAMQRRALGTPWALAQHLA